MRVGVFIAQVGLSSALVGFYIARVSLYIARVGPYIARDGFYTAQKFFVLFYFSKLACLADIVFCCLAEMCLETSQKLFLFLVYRFLSSHTVTKTLTQTGFGSEPSSETERKIIHIKHKKRDGENQQACI